MNNDKDIARTKRWVAENPDRSRAIKARCRQKNRQKLRASGRGCSIESFRLYIESKFLSGMTWDNYGPAWHIDHIMPCAIFDLTKPEHQKRCFHFSNMQPLFARDNLSKNAQVPSVHQFDLL